MLFHSWEFLFVFLPTVYAGFVFLVKTGRYRTVLLWITLASLVFYGWWNPSYLGIIISSIAVNFSVGWLGSPETGHTLAVRRRWLTFGVVLNLAALGYYKYANFFIDNINALFGVQFNMAKVILPLAMSFFTFQQIVFLVQRYRGVIQGCCLLEYAFAVSFFPHLIAGPIVQYQELLPQIARESWRPLRWENLQVATTMFVLGLFKKMVLADGCGEYASPIFNALREGSVFSAVDGWVAVVAYGFQIYFDFSGYSDMATGLARAFGIILPINFRAPYRALSIIEFWRRWHVTLSRFLRDYLYIPLGGGRRGELIRYRNLFVTMLLGGIWHGAGYTFVIWGALHGFYLASNHLFRAALHRIRTSFPELCRHTGSRPSVSWLQIAISWALTMFCVFVAWVLFRAEDLPSATSLLQSMFLLNANAVSNLDPKVFGFLLGYGKFYWLLVVGLIVLLAPTTQQYLRNYSPQLETSLVHSKWPAWHPTCLHGCVVGFLLFLTVRRYFSLAPTEFLYFEF